MVALDVERVGHWGLYNCRHISTDESDCHILDVNNVTPNRTRGEDTSCYNVYRNRNAQQQRRLDSIAFEVSSQVILTCQSAAPCLSTYYAPGPSVELLVNLFPQIYPLARGVLFCYCVMSS